MPERRRKYTTEFKTEAAKMVVESGCPIAEIAREMCPFTGPVELGPGRVLILGDCQ